MSVSQKEFLRRAYSEQSTDQLIDRLNQIPISETAIEAIRSVLSERGISPERHGENSSYHAERLQNSAGQSQQKEAKDESRHVIHLFALPIAFVLEILYPIFVGLVSLALQIEIRCTASIHGSRSVPCSFSQLISESISTIFLWNVFSFGGITFAVYCLLLSMYFLVSKLRTVPFGFIYIGTLFGVFLAFITANQIEAYLGSTLFCIVLAYCCEYYSKRFQ
jgi:hypothetical protein